MSDILHENNNLLLTNIKNCFILGHYREFIILFHGILIGIIASVTFRGRNYFLITSTIRDEQYFQCVLADVGRVKRLLKSYSCQGNLPIKH